MKAAIEVAKREDNAGVGTTKERYAWDKKWWEGHYASAADKFAAAVGSKGEGSSSDSSDSDSDDEEAELMMKLGAALGKDGIVSSGSKADLKLMEELASGNHRGSTFGGRSGKLERIAKFEAEQLAKYGVQHGAAAAPVVVTATTSKRETKTTKKDSKKAKKEKKAKKHADSDSNHSARDVEVVRGAAYEGEPSTSTKERDWWSKAGFAWGGVVGSKREQDLFGDGSDGKSTKRGFTEDDQENLFKSAHETGVVRGTHRGLGGKGLIKTEWEGKRKTSFDDEDDDKDATRRNKKEKKEKKEKKSSKP